jgi:hypothetical protein
MASDRSLIGDGPYPLNGPVAILVRLGFLISICGVAVGELLPGWMVPDFVRSRYLQHFAAFYVATLFGLAAAPRSRLRTIGVGMILFASGLELVNVAAHAQLRQLNDNWIANVGGVLAALAPALAERFRARIRLATTPPSANE